MRTALLAAIVALTPVAAHAAGVDGAAVHFTEIGKSPKTIVFVHGWTCNETSWSAQVPAFQGNYRVVTIDLPGHGKSGFPTDKALSMDVFVRAVEAVRAEVGAERIVLIGHSMGAAVIWQYAIRHPERVAGLVPVDGAPVVGGGGGRGGGGTDMMRGEGGRRVREKMVAGMITTASPEVQAQIRQMMLVDASERTAAEALGAMFGPKETGGPLDVPGLGIYAGDRSGTLAPELPNSRVVGFPGSGHFLMMEKPAEFNKLLGDFLASLTF